MSYLPSASPNPGEATTPAVVRRTETDMTTKLLVRFADGNAAEVVAVRRPGKGIVCFSTIIGCPVGCRFCWSGIVDSFVRPLTSGEMLALVGLARAHLPDGPFVYSAMGEGEPALNVDEVMETFAGLDLRPSDKLALSTSGPNLRSTDDLIEACLRSARPIKIQYSLHVGSGRQILMRGAKAAPEEVLRRLAVYEELRPSMVELNVVPMRGVNTDPGRIDDLTTLLSSVVPGHRWSVKVNRHNPVAPSSIVAASEEERSRLVRAIQEAGHRTEWYETDGGEIEAACGQLHHQAA